MTVSVAAAAACPTGRPGPVLVTMMAYEPNLMPAVERVTPATPAACVHIFDSEKCRVAMALPRGELYHTMVQNIIYMVQTRTPFVKGIYIYIQP